MDLYGFISIVLQIGACLMCYFAGKENGVREIVDTLVSKRLLTAKDLKKLESNGWHLDLNIRSYRLSSKTWVVYFLT